MTQEINQVMESSELTLPYNPNNTLLQESDLRKILDTYDIHDNVNNIDIYRKALVHKSYCTRKNENFLNGNVNCPHDCLPLQEESNERLEFLGDAIRKGCRLLFV